ncbi:MAG: serine/threonine-protein kinase, partial [Deltaproteobacteria bacterium]
MHRRVAAEPSPVDEPGPNPDTLDGHCLAEEVIYALACGGLEARERSKALAHLDECELCQALLAEEVRAMPDFVSGDDAGVSTLIQVGALVGGRYRIQRFVARGGMGEVYEAWDVLLSERVALKTINPVAASADQARASARFKQEVQLSRRVADPHVCRIYEFGHHVAPGFGTLAYLTMEYIEGQTLGARVRKGPRLAIEEVLEVCRQMLRGLAAAHAVGVLHRDLKTENVMLRANPNPGALHAVIMDFGLARLLGDQAHLLTERHELVGSAAYMAPEQLEEGAELSQATDVYAFGVVLFEMLTGRLPFDGKSAVAIAMRRLTQKAPLPSSFVPEVSSAWDALVLRCLERDVSRRFPSTKEVAAALEAIAQAPLAGASRPRRRQGVVLIATCVAALVSGIVYWSARGGEQAERTQTLTLQPGSRLEPAAPPPTAAPEPAAPVAPAVAAEAAVASEPAAAPGAAPAPVPPRRNGSRSAASDKAAPPGAT